MRISIFASLILGSAFASDIPMKVNHSYQFSGICDASAGVAISEKLFVVANDEDNVLRVYETKDKSRPVETFDLTSGLGLSAKNSEMDLEGAARIGDDVYWIGSHGRNKEGKARPNRHRLFATSLKMTGDRVQMKLAGTPCSTLLDDLIAEPRFARFHFKECAQRAPKERDALNIESLCATPEKQLLIGFRNPIPDGKALLIPLLNPEDVVRGKRAKFGDAILLELKGLGIRDMTYVQGVYFIIAGPFDGEGKSQLYWTKDLKRTPVLVQGADFGKTNPEAIFAQPTASDRSRLHILMDNGANLVDGIECKGIKNPADRFFQSLMVTFERKK